MPDLRAYQPSFTAGELSPALWARVDLAKYATGLKKARNIFVHPHGGASNRPGLEFVNEVKVSADETALIPFQFNTEQSYILEFGNRYMRVYRNGGLVLKSGAAYEVNTPYSKAHVGELVFAQEADIMYIVHPEYSIRKLSRLADDDWTLTTVSFGPSISAPTNVSAVAQAGPGSGTTYRYRVAAISEDGEESLPSAAVAVDNDLTVVDARNRITWDAVTGAERYIVYKQEAGAYGYIGGTTGTGFNDNNIVPDLADGPQIARNPFSGSGKRPRCVTFIEQRLAFASTKNEPQGVWLSQSANYENFGYAHPAKASDAVTFRIRAREVNEIRSMLPMRGLMLLTSGAEWIVSGGSTADAITPSSIKIDNHGYRGAARVQPIVVGNTVLFAQKRGGVVRDFSYELTEDGFTGKDLTVLARHLFENREIKSWAYSQAPYSIVWVVLDNGELLSLTYMKEHDVWAWTKHESGAEAVFEHVAVIGEGTEDVPYFVVRRKINGAWKRYIERLHSRYFDAIEDAFFVDSGLSYEGAPVDTLLGLDHLEGCEVVALADGNVVRGLTVDNGSITLPIEASKVHVGLPYEATIQTLDIDLGSVAGLGTVQGRMKTVAQITLRVENTRGIWVGQHDDPIDSGRLVEYKQRTTEAWNEAVQPITGDIDITSMWDWTRGANVVIKQFDPLPMTILAIMPDLTIGR